LRHKNNRGARCPNRKRHWVRELFDKRSAIDTVELTTVMADDDATPLKTIFSVDRSEDTC
jgi:hypothetical protein